MDKISPDTRVTIPSFRTDFCDLLQIRLHGVLEHFLELNNRFSLIINLLDRTSTETLQSGNFVYAGVEKQLGLLKENFNKKSSNENIEKAADFLRRFEFPAVIGVTGGTLFDKFRQSLLGFSDIRESKLELYFEKYFDSKEFENPGQENEYPILDFFFDIKGGDKFISLPLIQFGKFDGVVHIVYKADLSEKINTEAAIKETIRLFSLEFESLLLNFDNVESNIFKASLLKYELDALKSVEYYQRSNKNPILKELKFRDYYINNESFFVARVEQNDEIHKLILEQYRKSAIMSILIDSYAHNISAHSLTALNWLFYQRADHLIQSEKEDDNYNSENNTDLPLIFSEKPLAGEIHPLFKFLLEKGAFWTGLTRDRHFGGQINSLYTILRYDFVNNPLYLGTIAYSEGILKLNIEITIYEQVEFVEGSGGVKRKKKVKRSKDGQLMQGQFVTIDLNSINYAPDKLVDPSSLNYFVLKGEKFEILKEELSTYKVFFPGGVIGKHAFFTILENEIRNVKHYDNEETLNEMKKKGLTLCLSIHEASYDDAKEHDQEHERELYKIGVWLKHPTLLSKKLLMSRLDKLKSDIIDEKNYSPKLGGTYQDKVCSAMLFNNTFLSVQRQHTDRDQKYYPWIKTGSGESEHNGYVMDYELSLRRTIAPQFKRSIQYFEKEYKEHEGYFKKFFYLWKGTDIFTHDKLAYLQNEWENLSRFRFVYIPKEDKEGFQLAKSAGVIRNINQNIDNVELAYQIWLENWLKIKKPHIIRFLINGQNIAHLNFNSTGVEFLNYKDLASIEEDDYQGYQEQLIHLAHGGKVSNNAKVCKYRSHGILQNRFCKGQKLEIAKMEEKDAAELLEMLLTSVCIFDNRIANRVEKSNKSVLQKSLNCSIYKEKTDLWDKEKEKGFSRYHFLVVHLSFIEAFKGPDGFKKYSENDIGSFIKEEIVSDEKFDQANFVLVITTGRGRTQWWTKLEEHEEYKNYTAFTTFRPVESLIKSIERAISMGDDFELKYRLTKVLFGS